MPMFPNGLNSLRDFLRATVAAVVLSPAPAYAALTTNSAPATALANPIADTFVVSSAAALAGSTEGSLTWVNYPFGTNPGAHNKQADGSGVGGNAAGRACSVLPYGVADGEISANVTVFVTSSEGQASLIGRADTTVAAGTYYEVRYSYGQYVSLHRLNAGTDTSLGTASVTGTTNTFYPLKMRIVDVGDGTTSIRCFFNNVEVLSVIDSAPLTTTGWGLLGGRNVRYKNLLLGGWQLQTQFVYTPNVYDQSAANVVVSGLTATAPGATLSLANNDGGRFALVETTGFNEIAGYKQYNLVTTSTTTKIADGNARSIQVTETPQANAGYTAKTATLSLGVVAPLPTRTTRLASAGGIIPNATTNAGTGNGTAYQSQVHWYVGSDDMSQLQFVFDNWQLANGQITGLNAGLTITKASFHIPGAPIPLVPVTFSGGRSVLLADATSAMLSDPIYPAQFGLTVFSRGTMGWLRSAGSVPAVSGAVASIPCGRYINSGYPVGGFMERGGSAGSSQVDSTVNMVGSGGTSQSQAAGATAMWGKSVNTGRLAVFGFGDSIMDGLFDIPSTITVPSRLSAIAFGVTLGILGRYGLAIEDGRAPRRRDLVVDALTFGILMLVTIQLADQFRLERGGCVMAGAGVGICGTHAVRWFRDRFLAQRLTSNPQVAQLADAARAADIAKVPAGVGVPDEIGAHSGTPDDPLARAGAALQGAFRRPTITRPPADQIELLRRLDPPAE